MRIYIQDIYLKQKERDRLQNVFEQLPEDFQNKIKSQPLLKQIQRLTALALLSKMSLEVYPSQNVLNALKTNFHGKPYIDDELQFSFSYTTKKVAIAVASKSPIGIDLVMVSTLSILDFEDYFTQQEFQFIQKNENPLMAFYKLWTRKEAVIKCLGKGFYIDLNAFDCSNNEFFLEHKKLHLKTFAFENHILSIASEVFPNQRNDYSIEFINTEIK